ncbi:type II toxin-antitoxin system PemK/MazF family toxin [Candidatus Woesearchaeota archaeon]|nr:type II toxin-antitoxin system PemK/MazF family toxin [Candidatus Woesearchaeota archaeon]
MESFTKKEIVLFPFPYTDLSNRKLRPCLVLSEDLGDDVILCQITSKRTKKDKYCVEIKKNNTLNGSLQLNSYVRCDMLFTAEKNQVIRKICKIKDEDYEKVVYKIREIIK